LLRLNTGRLETSTVGDEPRPNFVVIGDRGDTGFTQTGSLFEVLEGVEATVVEGGALSEVVGLERGESGIGVGFEGGQLLGRDIGHRFVLLEEGLSRFGGGELTRGELVLRSALGLTLAGAVLGGRVREERVLLEEGQQVVVLGSTHGGGINNKIMIRNNKDL
jgi:hypothetical protein